MSSMIIQDYIDENALYNEDFVLSTLLKVNKGVVNIEGLRDVARKLTDKLDRMRYYREQVTLGDIEQLKADIDFILLGVEP